MSDKQTGEDKALPSKEEFSDWYNEVIDRAELSDKRYQIKGMNVWRPYGWAIMRSIDEHIREEMEATDHDEVCFPLLIPETAFQKEAQHIKGFSDEVYWVRHAGANELDVPMLLRPTSETAMYPMFALWIRAHTDLPLKTFQLVNTFRYETKQTRAFIRVREIHFFESHTCHADFEDAERQIREDVEICRRFMRKLCLPYVLCKRPDWDKFAGAHYTVGIDAIMPSGRTLQLGSIHQYKTNFSKPYEVIYEDEDGEHKHVHQTTYGMSERLLGAVIAAHGDDKGMILPPSIAPKQVVMVPIIFKDSAEDVMAEIHAIKKELKDAGITATIDNRDMRPGAKYYHWELRGVPLRLELGARDMKKGVVTLARRDNGEKTEVPRQDIAKSVKDMLASIDEGIYERAQELLHSSIKEVEDTRDAGPGLNRMAWCGEESCGHQIEDDTEMAVLGTPWEPYEKDGNCIVCGKPTRTWIYVAKTY